MSPISSWPMFKFGPILDTENSPPNFKCEKKKKIGLEIN